jgi:hypothetical protein
MLRSSFRWIAHPYVPRADRRKQALLAVAVLIATGCGASHVASKRLAGSGYSFEAPPSWTVVRAQRSVQVSRDVQLVSVARFPLLRAYRPKLWPKVVVEIDRSAAELAAGQKGSVSSRKTLTIAGIRARRYDIAYARGGKELTERVGFVLHGKTEYELLCRFERGKDSAACDLLFRSFRLT